MYATHYSNPGSLVTIDTAALGSATKTLDIAAYALVDREILEAIGQASLRGVTVRIYLDRTELQAADRGDPSGNRWAGHILQASPNVQIKVKMSSVLMHLKSYCIDGTTLRSGSANFSSMGEIQQDNDVTFTDDLIAVAAFQVKFDMMWARPDNQTVAQALTRHAPASFGVFYPASRR